MKNQFKYLFLILPFLVFGFSIQAQTNYKLSKADFSVSGTSSLHDWTMDTKSGIGEIMVKKEEQTLKSIEKLKVSFKGETLKSGKSGMDDNAYKALKTKNYPEISFTLQNVKSIVKKSDHYLVEASGTLSIGGESKTINVQSKAYPTADAVRFTGSHSFKMTDFNIEPPTALLGTIKTGDAITINYNLTF